MHHLRSTVLRLRPVTAAQAARSGPTPAPAMLLKTTAAPEPSFTGTGANYVEEMYAAWRENPGASISPGTRFSRTLALELRRARPSGTPESSCWWGLSPAWRSWWRITWRCSHSSELIRYEDITWPSWTLWASAAWTLTTRPVPLTSRTLDWIPATWTECSGFLKPLSSEGRRAL
ncbi:hypothetical protein OJAV_G00235560 [Oryzias javanicus]|uniref:Uncharacterized protein n=1 Tax=Oryzias javanicus TaxID=123683 RepID=A0A3S2LWY1_ORYJA|nr:hypothetical protein OJAV_G00235560 [Oryzias javanicus]